MFGRGLCLPISGLPRRHARAPSIWYADCAAPSAGLYQGSGPPRPMDHAKQCSPKAKELPMVEVIERETVGEAIEATVNYILDNGDKIFTQTASPGATDVRSGGTLDPHRVTIRNARLQAGPFALDREGFRFVRHDTKVADFFDEDQIRRVYYPEMEALVKAESGASRVVVFDHTLRTADADEREARKIREVVRRVHNDYTEWSGPQRVR